MRAKETRCAFFPPLANHGPTTATRFSCQRSDRNVVKKYIEFFLNGYYGWLKLVSFLWPGNETAKRAVNRWKSSATETKLRFSQLTIPTVLIVRFFNSQGITHEECVLPGNTANAQFYRNVSDGFCKWIARFRPALRKDRSFFALQDTAPVAHTTQQFLRNFQSQKQFPYSLTS